MYNYDISFPQTNPCSTVCFWSNSRTQTHPHSTIAPHWSSSYPEYLSPTWDEDTQRAVVWARLQEHRKLANRSLARINEWYKALRQEQQTQVESSHESSSHDTPTSSHWTPLPSSHWSVVAYVIDSPNRREDSYVIHTQPTSADVGDSCRIDTSADVG